MFAIKTGYLYFVADGIPWTSKIDRATRFTAEEAERIVTHITKGPKDPKGNHSPTWKWVQYPVMVGRIIGVRDISTMIPVTLEDGTVEMKKQKKTERYEFDSRPTFEIVEVTDGVLYDFWAHFRKGKG